MPHAIVPVVPILANVAVAGVLGPLSNPSQINKAITQAVSAYFTLPFGIPAEQPVIAAAVANAALGQLTSLSVNLYYNSAPSTVVEAVSGRLFTRVLLNNLTIDIPLS
jgi:hypothetical protein